MHKEASKLTVSQIQQSLGNIDKKKKVKLFRNSLAFPYNKTWPGVEQQDSTELLRLLENSLAAAKLNSVKLPWKDICNLSKEERRAKRVEIISMTEKENSKRALIATGYSEVTRGLEHEDLCCCVIAAEVEPFVLIKNLVSLAQIKGIPLVIIPTLKLVIKKTLEYSAMAIGFKNAVEKDSNCIFHPIYKCIKSLSSKFPMEQICVAHENDMSGNTSTANKLSQPVKTPLDIKNLYHLRIASPKGPRVFIPPREHKADKSAQDNTLSFISLGEDSQIQNFKQTNNNKQNNINEEDDDSDDIDENKILFQLDTKPDVSLTESWEKTNIVPTKKRKKKKQKTPHYKPTKIKIMQSNVMRTHTKNKK